MTKRKRGRKARKGASRVHFIIDNKVLKAVRHEAAYYGLSLSMKVERILKEAVFP